MLRTKDILDEKDPRVRAKNTEVEFPLCEEYKSIIPEIKKKTFRNGKHMTVGYIEYDEKNYREKIKAMEDLMRQICSGQYIFKTE